MRVGEIGEEVSSRCGSDGTHVRRRQMGVGARAYAKFLAWHRRRVEVWCERIEGVGDGVLVGASGSGVALQKRGHGGAPISESG